MLVYWIWLAELTEITLRQKTQLLQRFSDAEEIYFAKLDSATEVDSQVARALENKDLSNAERILNKCIQKNIRIVTYQDPEYPARLRNISDPPVLLYYKGTLPDFSRQPVVAVVGTRKATPYGLSATRKLSQQIAACGGLLVSGAASGIDAAAMYGALDTQNPVIGVLGNGVDMVYPVSNRKLYADTERFGCLLSEYPPGSRPERWHFPQRNRIISGIADGVLVTEAPERSGALITARCALEQGRDVFVIPGNIDVAACAGSNGLLQDGAIPVLSGWDVMKEYAPLYPDVVENRPVVLQVERVPQFAKVAQPPQGEKFPSDKIGIDNRKHTPYSGIEIPCKDLTEDEKKVAACLPTEPRPVDEVIEKTGLPAGRVLSILTKLAIKGVAINHPGRLVSAGIRIN